MILSSTYFSRFLLTFTFGVSIAACSRKIQGTSPSVDGDSGGSVGDGDSALAGSVGDGDTGGSIGDGDGDGDTGGSTGEGAPCEDDEYERLSTTGSTAGVCTQLSVCSAGEYEILAPTKTRDRRCKVCTDGTFSTEQNARECQIWTECELGKIESVAPKANRDRVCNGCGEGLYEDGSACESLTICTDSQYESTAATSTSDRTCSALTNCDPGSWASTPDANTDRVCTPCDEGFSTTENASECISWTVCGDDEEVTVEASRTRDRQCVACAQDTHSSGPNATSCKGISAGWWHACTVDSANGRVRCWGLDDDNQSTIPLGLVNVHFNSVSAGGYHTCAVRSDNGRIECWGRNSSDQATPIDGEYVSVSAGGWHTCGLLASGGVNCWGASGSDVGATGSFEKIASGGWGHTFGLRTNGDLSCFMDISQQQDGFRDVKYIDVDAWAFGGCGLLADGTVECWGQGDSWNPVEGVFDSLEVGFEPYSMPYICGVKADGYVSCNDADFGASPTIPQPNVPFTSISAGADFVCGIVETDGLIACWGWDVSGRTDVPASLKH